MSEPIDFFNSFEQLAAFCSQEEYKGYDPYDSLNSKLFQAVPLLSKSRIAKLAWTQFFKRAPFNLRPLVGVPKEYNPKALGLFLTSYCNLYEIDAQSDYLDQINFLVIEYWSFNPKDGAEAAGGIILTGRQGHFSSLNIHRLLLLPLL